MEDCGQVFVAFSSSPKHSQNSKNISTISCFTKHNLGGGGHFGSPHHNRNLIPLFKNTFRAYLHKNIFQLHWTRNQTDL